MTIVRNILGFIVGLFAGGIVNMGIILAGSKVISPPPGVDVNDVASIAAAMPLFGPKDFVIPFLAHALGTLAGALIGYLIAASFKNLVAYLVGTLFLAGGIAACFMIPAPLWFMALDLIAAYIPMAFLATLIGRQMSNEPGS